MKEVIEQLKLHVDLAVLSACNTVGEPESDKLGHGEGFMGMSRAFLFAGARRLLVSHWAVDSPAAKDLLIKTFAYLRDAEHPSWRCPGRSMIYAACRTSRGQNMPPLRVHTPIFGPPLWW